MDEDDSRETNNKVEPVIFDITEEIITTAIGKSFGGGLDINRDEVSEAGPSSTNGSHKYAANVEIELDDIVSDHDVSGEINPFEISEEMPENVEDNSLDSQDISQEIEDNVEEHCLDSQEISEIATTSTDQIEDGTILCPYCNGPSGFSQYSKSSYRPKNRAQVVWIYRSRCTNLNCALWFGPCRRFDSGTFIEVRDDGRPLHEPSPVKIEPIELDEIEEKVLEVQTTVDGFDFFDTIPSILLAECSGLKCEKCEGDSEVRAYKKAVFKAKTRPWIFRTKCKSESCGEWFGKCMRLDRSSITRVDDTGKPFGRSQVNRVEEIEAEESTVKQESESEKDEDEPEDHENDDSHEEDDPENENDQKVHNEVNQHTGKPEQKRRKKRKSLFQSRKQASVKKRKLQVQSDIEAGIVQKPEKAAQLKPSRGYVYVLEPVGGFPKEEEVVTGPRKSRSQSHVEATPEKQDKVKDVASKSPVKPKPASAATDKKMDKRLLKKEKDRLRYLQMREKKLEKAMMKSSEKVVTPTKKPPVVVKSSSITEIPNSSTSPSSSSGSSNIEYTTSGTQLGDELLIETDYYKNLYIEELNANFKPQLVVRMNSLPLMVRATVLDMKRIITEQESQIKEFQINQDKFKALLPKVSERIKQIRLTYSDELSNIRQEISLLQVEFRQNQAEFVNLCRKKFIDFDKAKKDLDVKLDDANLKCKSIEKKVTLKEAEIQYEKDRAEYFLNAKERYEQQKNEAKKLYKDIESKLSDTVYIKNEQKCTHCQIFDKLVKNMKKEVVEYQIQRDQAFKEKRDCEARTQNAERCAQILSSDVDKLRYEIRTWKSQYEKLKEQNEVLTKKSKQNGALLVTKVTTPNFNSPSTSSTPKYSDIPISTSPSIGTPATAARKERISPLEDGEIDDESNHGAQTKKVADEKKVAKAPPIDVGFASWIPKDQIDAPAPSIPTLSSPFGVPKNAIPAPKKVVEKKLNLPPSQAPLPWDPKSRLTEGMSDTLKIVAAQVEAERFFGTMPPPKERKVTAQDTIPNSIKPSTNPILSPNQNSNQKKGQNPKPNWVSPPTKKMKKANNQPKQSNIPPSDPDKPSTSNQGFAEPRAQQPNPFGVKTSSSNESINSKKGKKSGQQKQQPKKNFAPNRGNGPAPWAGGPKGQQQQTPFQKPKQLMPQRDVDPFFGSPSGSSERSFSSGLPWHRNDNCNSNQMNMPFGNIPMRNDSPWGQPSNSSWSNETNWTNDNMRGQGPPPRNLSFFNSPQQPPQNQQQFGQPQTFMKRSFWD